MPPPPPAADAGEMAKGGSCHHRFTVTPRISNQMPPSLPLFLFREPAAPFMPLIHVGWYGGGGLSGLSKAVMGTWCCNTHVVHNQLGGGGGGGWDSGDADVRRA